MGQSLKTQAMLADSLEFLGSRAPHVRGRYTRRTRSEPPAGQIALKRWWLPIDRMGATAVNRLVQVDGQTQFIGDGTGRVLPIVGSVPMLIKVTAAQDQTEKLSGVTVLAAAAGLSLGLGHLEPLVGVLALLARLTRGQRYQRPVCAQVNLFCATRGLRWRSNGGDAARFGGNDIDFAFSFIGCTAKALVRQDIEPANEIPRNSAPTKDRRWGGAVLGMVPNGGK